MELIIYRGGTVDLWVNDRNSRAQQTVSVNACVHACVPSHFSRVQLSAALWTVARQAPLSVGFSRQNTGVGCRALLQGALPNPGIEPTSLRSSALAGRFLTTCTTWEALFNK